MKVTYMLWFLDGKSWRLIAEGPDKVDLTKDIKKDIEFSHRDMDYIISAEPYFFDGKRDATYVYHKFCVTRSRGW